MTIREKEDKKGEKPVEGQEEKDKPIVALTEEDVRIMQAYGAGSYSNKIKSLENEIKAL